MTGLVPIVGEGPATAGNTPPVNAPAMNALPKTSPATIAPRTSAPARMLSSTFVRGFIVTMRPYLLFVSGITGLCGLSLASLDGAGGPARQGIASTLLLAAAFFLSYGFGQALTDCFQMDTDAISSPYRPLVTGVIRRTDVLITSLLGLAACGSVLVLRRPVNLVPAALSVTGLATYTWFKRRWWGGPFYNAAIVGLLFVMGFLAGGGNLTAVGRPAVAAALAAVIFGYADFVLTGYFKDVSADRATGYHTFPVVFGTRKAAWASHGLAAATLVSVGLSLFSIGSAGKEPSFSMLFSPALFSLAGTAALVIGHAGLHTMTDEAQSHRAIGPVVHAYILLLSGIAAAARPGWAPALAILYAVFVATLGARPMKEQI